MLTLADAKGYLRVDGDAEDGLIQNMVDASENYLKGAVSGYSTLYAGDSAFSSTADAVRLAWIAEAYRNRDAMNDGRPNDRHLSYMLFSQITQLQNWVITP